MARAAVCGCGGVVAAAGVAAAVRDVRGEPRALRGRGGTTRATDGAANDAPNKRFRGRGRPDLRHLARAVPPALLGPQLTETLDAHGSRVREGGLYVLDATERRAHGEAAWDMCVGGPGTGAHGRV